MSGGGSGRAKETKEEKELARVAGEKWNDYVQRFIPFENEFINRIEVTDQDRQDLQGTVIGGANKAFSQVEKETLGHEIGKGAKPGSGRFYDALNRVMRKRGKSLGYRGADAYNDMDSKRATNLQSAINIGRGKEADAFSGMGELASAAHRDAISDANESNIRSEGNNQALGTVIGGATRIWGQPEEDGG